MKTEKTIRRIMVRYNCSREEAKAAPEGVLDLLPEDQPILTEAEIEYGKKVAARFNLEFGGQVILKP